MGIKTAIEYCDSSINPLVGCTGCDLYHPDPGKNHCYAATLCRHYAGLKGWPKSFVEPEFFPGRIEKALKWPDLTGITRPDKPWLDNYPRIVFLNDLSDGFSPSVDIDWAEPYIEAMSKSPHIWLWLTRWPERMKIFFNGSVSAVPSNFWLGTSITRPGAESSNRIEDLFNIHPGTGVTYWLSIEPLLHKIDLSAEVAEGLCTGRDRMWVVAGGESGLGARPMHPGWARLLRNQCQAASVPFFFKQWGAWKPIAEDCDPSAGATSKHHMVIGGTGLQDVLLARVGKRRAGRLLDGKKHSRMPLEC